MNCGKHIGRYALDADGSDGCGSLKSFKRRERKSATCSKKIGILGSQVQLNTLEELLNYEITSAAKKSQSAMGTAGITREDIRQSGAIPDLLRHVPGQRRMFQNIPFHIRLESIHPAHPFLFLFLFFLLFPDILRNYSPEDEFIKFFFSDSCSEIICFRICRRHIFFAFRLISDLI